MRERQRNAHDRGASQHARQHQALPIATDLEGLAPGRQPDPPFIAQVQREPQHALHLV